MIILYVYLITAIVCAIGISTFHGKGNPEFSNMQANLAALIIFTALIFPAWIVFIGSFFAKDYNKIRRLRELDARQNDQKIEKGQFNEAWNRAYKKCMVKSSSSSLTARAKTENTHIKPSTSDANAAVNIALLWKSCADEYFTKTSVRIGESITLYPWENIAAIFGERVLSIGVFPQSEIQQMETRVAAWLDFINSAVLPNRKHFNSDEIARVGELIAVAIVSGLEIAVTSDPIRAALIYDLLPKDTLQMVGLGRNVFDELYFKAAGHARPKRLGMCAADE